MGPLGLLCGACGSGVTTEEFWICNNCGNKFTSADVKEKIREEEKAAKKYRQDKEILFAAGNKTHEEIEADVDEARTEYASAAKNYQEFLDQYAAGSNGELRRYAKILKIEYLKIIVWIALFFGLFLFFSDVDIGFFIAIPSIIFLAVYYPLAKKAKTELAKVDPEILVKAKKVEEAKEKKNHAERLRKTRPCLKNREDCVKSTRLR